MKSKLLRYLSVPVIIVFFIQSSTVFGSTFSDVSITHPNEIAITYLQSNGVVQGYEDGTFRPDQPISRTEFLKIVLEGTEVNLDIDTASGFPDIDENQWYAPYVRKAKYEGWIQGYPDGTFQPLKHINKVEALKILGEVQEWDRLDLAEVPSNSYDDTYRFTWYSPYVYFAKEEGILTAETNILNPSEEITRGYMAQLMYQTIIKDVINYSGDKTAEDKINEVQDVDNPEDFSTINSDYFSEIELDSTLPNTFYKNEIYIMEGEITNGGSYDTIFAFLAEDNGSGNDYTHFIGTVSGNRFEIPMVFRNAGTYQLGVIPGNNGESKIAPIHVLDGIPGEGTATNSDTPSGLSIDFEDDATTISWNKTQNDVFRIYFMQNNNVESYFVRDVDTLEIVYNDFKTFEEDNIKWRVYGAQADSLAPVRLSSKWGKSADTTFKGVKHHFKLTLDDALTYNSLPETLTSTETFSVSGFTEENIFAEGAVIKPDGSIDMFDIHTSAQLLDYYGNDVIPANSSFNFSYKPAQTGTYILEINDQGGSAVVNVPIYIGNGIPIIPDFFDLQDPMEITESLHIVSSRNELLSYINEERASHGLSGISMRDDLNNLSQAHADDMGDLNYFSHINLDGETPDDRRINYGISTEVGENLAHAPTVYFAHKALMRSAIHRQNVLDPTWDNVGLGISLGDSGYLFIAEEFSHAPWNDGDLEQFEYEILNGVNNNREAPFILNSELRNISREWSADMINLNFFSFTAPSGINLIDVVQSNGITSEGKAYILKEGSAKTLQEKLLEESDILNSQWKEIGIGIKQDDWSNLFLTVIYTEV
ncbi:S-layer homology domain-containing protein [Patescibacteria group bacterium]